MRALLRVSALALAACASSAEPTTVHATAEAHGRALFRDPAASPSVSNRFACATCHPDEGGGRIFPGGALAGATLRTRFWGGARADLLEAINDCRSSFMDARAPWTKDDADARALFAYLDARREGPREIAFTVVPQAPDLPPGDPTRGASAFALACRICHGEAHTGAGRLVPFAPRLPDDFEAEHRALGRPERRVRALRKIREGAFRDAAGSMPPFSREALTDDDVAGLLAFLGL